MRAQTLESLLNQVVYHLQHNPKGLEDQNLWDQLSDCLTGGKEPLKAITINGLYNQAFRDTDSHRSIERSMINGNNNLR